jgi:hypothetical protein
MNSIKEISEQFFQDWLAGVKHVAGPEFEAMAERYDPRKALFEDNCSEIAYVLRALPAIPALPLLSVGMGKQVVTEKHARHEGANGVVSEFAIGDRVRFIDQSPAFSVVAIKWDDAEANATFHGVHVYKLSGKRGWHQYAYNLEPAGRTQVGGKFRRSADGERAARAEGGYTAYYGARGAIYAARYDELYRSGTRADIKQRAREAVAAT